MLCTFDNQEIYIGIGIMEILLNKVGKLGKLWICASMSLLVKVATPRSFLSMDYSTLAFKPAWYQKCFLSPQPHIRDLNGTSSWICYLQEVFITSLSFPQVFKWFQSHRRWFGKFIIVVQLFGMTLSEVDRSTSIFI